MLHNSLKITYLKLQQHVPGANGLKCYRSLKQLTVYQYEFFVNWQTVTWTYYKHSDNECQIGQTYLTFCDWPAICCHVYNGMVLLSENVRYNILVKIVGWNYSSIPKLSTVKLLKFGNG